MDKKTKQILNVCIVSFSMAILVSWCTIPSKPKPKLVLPQTISLCGYYLEDDEFVKGRYKYHPINWIGTVGTASLDISSETGIVFLHLTTDLKNCNHLDQDNGKKLNDSKFKLDNDHAD